METSAESKGDAEFICDRLMTRIGMLVQSSQAVAFVVKPSGSAGFLLELMSYVAGEKAPESSRNELIDWFRVLVQDCLRRGGDGCFNLKNGKWCLVIILGSGPDRVRAAAAFIVPAVDREEAVKKLRLLRGGKS